MSYYVYNNNLWNLLWKYKCFVKSCVPKCSGVKIGLNQDSFKSLGKKTNSCIFIVLYCFVQSYLVESPVVPCCVLVTCTKLLQMWVWKFFRWTFLLWRNDTSTEVYSVKILFRAAFCLFRLPCFRMNCFS